MAKTKKTVEDNTNNEGGFRLKVARNRFGKVVERPIFFFSCLDYPVSTEEFVANNASNQPMTVRKATQEDLKKVYDANPAYAKNIEAPADYKRPSQK